MEEQQPGPLGSCETTKKSIMRGYNKSFRLSAAEMADTRALRSTSDDEDEPEAEHQYDHGHLQARTIVVLSNDTRESFTTDIEPDLDTDNDHEDENEPEEDGGGNHEEAGHHKPASFKESIHMDFMFSDFPPGNEGKLNEKMRSSAKRPKCKKCNRYNLGECASHFYYKCSKGGHTIRECTEPLACFECSDRGHIRPTCPKLNQGAFKSIGGWNQTCGNTCASVINTKEAKANDDVITGTFPINNIHATILFDSGVNRSLCLLLSFLF